MSVFPFKLAAIDIDDTLVGHDKRIGAANREAVERLIGLGCRVVLASSRRHDNMLPFYRELGLSDFAVSCQGAVVRHSENGQVIHESLLPAPDVAELIGEGLDRGLTLMHWSASGIVVQDRTEWIERYSRDCNDPVAVADLRELSTVPAEKVVWGAQPEIVAALVPELARRFASRLVVTRTDDWFIEFTAPSATKAAGAAAVARHYGVDPHEVLAFGDGNNDASILAWAGLGVAMSHARPAARAAAKRVAAPGDVESSLARGIDGVLGAAGVEDDAPVAAAHPTAPLGSPWPRRAPYWLLVP